MITVSRPGSTSQARVSPPYIVALLAILTLVVVLLTLSQRRDPLHVVARQYLQAFVDCDGEVLYNLSYEQERAANTFTPASLERVCRQVARPILERYQVGAIVWQNNGNYGDSGLPMRTASGFPGELACIVYDTEGGPRASFTAVLCHLITIDYSLRGELPWVGETLAGGVVEGVAKYGAILEANGLTHRCNVRPDMGDIQMEPFKDYARRHQAYLDRKRAERAY